MIITVSRANQSGGACEDWPATAGTTTYLNVPSLAGWSGGWVSLDGLVIAFFLEIIKVEGVDEIAEDGKVRAGWPTTG